MPEAHPPITTLFNRLRTRPEVNTVIVLYTEDEVCEIMAAHTKRAIGPNCRIENEGELSVDETTAGYQLTYRLPVTFQPQQRQWRRRRRTHTTSKMP